MTGTAFLKRLKFQLDFLSPDDQKTVLGFYEKKLATAASPSEEEAIVKTFGSPESIGDQLKQSFLKKDHEGSDAFQEASFEAEAIIKNLSSTEVEEEMEKSQSQEVSSDLAEEEPEKESEKDTSDLIFSKPATPEHSPEIIHSLENKEIPALYGEKVVIQERIHPIEEIPLEPMDEANGLTPEEIELAKAKTLEKANHFDGDPERPVKTDNPEEGVDASKGKAGTAIQLDPEETPQTKEYPGILKTAFASSSLSPNAVKSLTIALSILASPLLVLAFGTGIFVYGMLSLVAICLFLIAFGLIAALVVCGVVELIYGFAMLFETVSVALIEIGLGTVLFALVTAVSALVYEFMFGVLPKAMKFITAKFKRYMKVLRCYLYGGNA